MPIKRFALGFGGGGVLDDFACDVGEAFVLGDEGFRLKMLCHIFFLARSIGGLLAAFDPVAHFDGPAGIALAELHGENLVSETLVSKALTELNGSLAPETFDGRFVTLVMVVIDPKTQEATVVNAGHMAPLVRHANGELSEIGESETGLPLMIDADYEYRQHVSQIAPGDTFVLFTDGITEAMDTNSQLYGIERLRERISCSNPQKLGQEIVEDVKQFTGGRPATDDMCLVCFGRDEV